MFLDVACSHAVLPVLRVVHMHLCGLPFGRWCFSSAMVELSCVGVLLAAAGKRSLRGVVFLSGTVQQVHGINTKPFLTLDKSAL